MTIPLTAREKADTRASIRHPNNVVAMQRLRASLGE